MRAIMGSTTAGGAMDTKAVSIGLILASAVLDSSALTVGPAQGAAWIGQPLELSFPITLEPGVDGGTLCPRADVHYADTPQDPNRVQIQQMPGSGPDNIRLRLTHSTLVDEPVVRVVLRVGCQQTVSRSYVLLADLPTSAPDTERSTATVPVVSAPLVEPAPQEVATPVPTEPPPARVPPRARETRPRDATQATPRARPKPPVVSRKAVAPPPNPGARLTLDPIEILVERVKTLESTTAAVPLEELVKDAGRVQQLQNDVQALLKQAEKNEAALQAMRERLEQAESDRLTTLLSFGLAALALLCAVAIAVVWSRRRPPLWSAEPAGRGSASPRMPPNTGDSTLPAQELQLVTPQPSGDAAAPATRTPLDVDLVEMDEWDWPKTGRQALGKR